MQCKLMWNLDIPCWQVQDLIAEAAEDARSNPVLPLIRLRVSNDDFFCPDSVCRD